MRPLIPSPSGSNVRLVINAISLFSLFSATTARLSASDKAVTTRDLGVQQTVIPNTIWFTWTDDLLETHRPRAHYENILKTIDIYKSAWNFDPTMSVNVVDDVNCLREIGIAEPRLVQHFKDEDHGPYRSDICRAALLYLYGGYYFDIDIEVVQPYFPPEGVSFISVNSCGGGCFYSSFIAAAPRHPILKQSLAQLLEVYDNALDNTLVGPVTLARAYLNLPPEERGETRLLEELELTENDYPDVERQDGWGRCNMAIHDPELQRVFFYARYVGSGAGCYTNKSNKKSVLPTIAHRFWFTYTHNVVKGDERDPLYYNVMSTIDGYRDAWWEPMAPINFLDDIKCAKYVKQAEPKLLPFFNQEKHGPYRGDICRAAVLYIFGGYYFDVDIKLVEPYIPDNKYKFVSVSSCGGGCMFSSFIACVKEHPILKGALAEMLDVYQNKKDTNLLGPIALANAYNALPPEDKEDVKMLEELDLMKDEEKYPEVERQTGIGNCNYVVHDSETAKVYFFARYVGYNGCGALYDSEDEDR